MEHATQKHLNRNDHAPIPNLEIEPRAVYTEITPKLARELLSKNEGNRNVRSDLVERYKRIIREGFWMPNNGESVKVDWNGNLADGQHRLMAIAESGITVKTFIMYDVDPDSFSTLDTGMRRSASEIFSMAGVANSAVTSGAMKRLYHYLRGSLTNMKSGRHAATAEELLNMFLNEHQEMRVAATWAYTKGMRAWGRPSVNAFIIYMLMRCGQAGDAFLRQLETGINLQEDSPAYVLRERLRALRLNKIDVQDYEIAALAFKAFNAYVQHKKLRQLVWDKEKEGFPNLLQCDIKPKAN